MFELDLPWWELMVRAAVVYFSLLVMVRISGKRTVGQFTPFELLVVMLLSESVSASLSGGDDSLAAGLILASTLIAVNLAIAYATARSSRLQVVIEGRPILIGRHGEIFKDRLLAQHISMADFEQALREADCELKDVRCAFLEADGKISILQKTA
ncbi:MAG: DUF421 domain-containing protein [Pseudomonadota bacterium]|nr:DUF421 domain-containing protein [Pseudomonadota bacterium]